MPVHKSAIKRVRQAARRRLHNRARKSAMRTAMKAVLSLKSKEGAQGPLSSATSLVDRLLKTGQIHKNRAAKYKSRLANYVNKLS
jgi:small subunit ribosomal protein S20